MTELCFRQCHGRLGTIVRWMAIVTMFSGVLFIPGISFGQEKYPEKSINFLLGYPPGGSADLGTRPLTEAASKALRQPIVILNKPGSAGAVAVTLLKDEKPDGYTIGLLPPGAVLAQHLRKLSYDTSKDFSPIMQFAENQYGLLVRSDSPWKTLKEFITYAKANPGKIRYTTSGVGSPHHLVMEQLALNEKLKLAHIPYEGGPIAITALLGGHVEASSSTAVWKKYVQSGQLRLLAVYGEKRIPTYPNTPTLIEQGYNIKSFSVLAVIGPKNLPSSVIETLHQALKKGMEDPDFIKVQEQFDQLPIYRSPQELDNFLKQSNVELGTLIQTLGLRK